MTGTGSTSDARKRQAERNQAARDDTGPAGELRSAASSLRALAEGATPGPWEVTSFDSGHSRYEMACCVVTAEHGDLICDMDGLSRSSNEFVAKDDGSADAALIAALGPPFALAVADLLDHADGMANWRQHIGNGPTADLVDRILAVARALGVAADGGAS